jgi:hypothetical protein
MPGGEALKMADICRQIIEDADANKLNETRYITLLDDLSVGALADVQSCSFGKQENYTELRKQWGILWNSPDDSLTNKQKSEKLKLSKLFFENIQMQDSILVLQLSKEDVVKQGFPKEYYEFFIENIQSINNFGHRTQEFRDSLPAIKEFILKKVDSLSVE